MLPWWRVMVSLAALPAAFQLASLYWCPESPSWLETFDKDRADEACIALWGARAILYEDPGSSSEIGGGSQHAIVGPVSAAAAAGTSDRGGPSGGAGAAMGGGAASSQPSPSNVAAALQPRLTALAAQAHDRQQLQATLAQQLAQHQQQQALMAPPPSVWLGRPSGNVAAAGGGLGALGEGGGAAGERGGTLWWSLGGGKATDLNAALLPMGDDEASSLSEQEEGCGFLQRYEYRWITMLALGLPVLQQASGAAAVLLYSSQVFPELAWPDEFPTVWGCLAVSALFMVASALAGPLSDAFGRRPMLLVSFAGISACLFSSAVITIFQNSQPERMDPTPSPVDALDITNTLLVLLYALFFGLGAGPLVPRYLDEMLPSRLGIRGRTMALGTALGWATQLVVVASFRPAVEGDDQGGSDDDDTKASLHNIGGLFLLYGLFSVLALVLVSVVLVESRGRCQAELEATLKLQPQPQLRHLFPAQGGGAGGPGSGGGGGTGWRQGAPAGGSGGGAGSAASSDTAAAAAAHLAGLAWKKLMDHQARQNAELVEEKLSQSF